MQNKIRVIEKQSSFYIWSLLHCLLAQIYQFHEPYIGIEINQLLLNADEPNAYMPEHTSAQTYKMLPFKQSSRYIIL